MNRNAFLLLLKTSVTHSPARCRARARSERPRWACAARAPSGTGSRRSAPRACTPCSRSAKSPRTARTLGCARTPPGPCSASRRSPAWCFDGTEEFRTRFEPWRPGQQQVGDVSLHGSASRLTRCRFPSLILVLHRKKTKEQHQHRRFSGTVLTSEQVNSSSRPPRPLNTVLWLAGGVEALCWLATR